MGQTNTDKLLSPIVGKALTDGYDLDARLDALEAAVAASTVTYTPAVLADWDGGVDPGDLDNALDQLAERVADVEVASGIAYTPAVATDWDGDADPGNVDGALDQLAERVDDNEISIGTLIGLHRRFTLALGAEAADVIPLTVTVTDGAGAAISLPVRFQLEIFDDAALDDIAVQAAFTAGISGAPGSAGTLLQSAAANARYIFQTDNAGVADIVISDIATASGLTVYIKISLIHTSTPAALCCAPVWASVIFDGV